MKASHKCEQGNHDFSAEQYCTLKLSYENTGKDLLFLQFLLGSDQINSFLSVS